MTGAGHVEPARAGRQSRARWLLVLAFVVVFLTVGVPRWFVGSGGAPLAAHTDAKLARLCRDHGGTPSTAPAGGANGGAQPFCTVRYGGEVYRMDAITPAGFDEDTADYQRQGCEEARREERASTAPGHRRRSFIYHPTTGVCEHRP